MIDGHPQPSRHRGGRNGFEPRIRVREREARVVELCTRGWTQREIATDVGVTQPAICRILRRVDDRLLHTMHRERIRLLVRLDQRVNHVFRQAHDGRMGPSSAHGP